MIGCFDLNEVILNKLIKKRIKKAPSIALTATTSGIAEAVSAPKIKAKKRKVSGIEMLSAFAKSLEIRELMA